MFKIVDEEDMRVVCGICVWRVNGAEGVNGVEREMQRREWIWDVMLMSHKVITTKHHDGFALFDTGASSNRNSLNYGPK